MSDYLSGNVLCPFYCEKGNQTIKCEGIMPGTSLRIGFDTKTHFANHMAKYCCQHYEECPICMILFAKYD